MLPFVSGRRKPWIGASLGWSLVGAFRALTIATTACLCLPPLQGHAADRRGTDIVISCGAQETRISTGSRIRNIDAIRITVDPANQCRVEASLQFKTGASRNQKTGPLAIKRIKLSPRVSDLPASTGKCFVFNGRSYCE